MFKRLQGCLFLSPFVFLLQKFWYQCLHFSSMLAHNCRSSITAVAELWNKLGLWRSDTVSVFFCVICQCESLCVNVWNLFLPSSLDLLFPWGVIHVLKSRCSVFDRNFLQFNAFALLNVESRSTFIKSQTNWLTIPVKIVHVFFSLSELNPLF